MYWYGTKRNDIFLRALAAQRRPTDRGQPTVSGWCPPPTPPTILVVDGN